MKTYSGQRFRDRTVRVYVERAGRRRRLESIAGHSGADFDYGYDGAGPAELARSILGDVLGRPPKWWLYRAFLGQFIEPLDQAAPWAISEAEIVAWLTMIEAQRSGEPGGP